MPNRQPFRDVWHLYLAMFLWAALIVVAPWRLATLNNSHWLWICYAVLAIMWIPVTIAVVWVFWQQHLIDKRWGNWLLSFGLGGVVAGIIAFILLGITDATLAIF